MTSFAWIVVGAGSCDDRPFSCKAGVAVFELPDCNYNPIVLLSFASYNPSNTNMIA